MTVPGVSVIIPVHDGAKYLPAAIRSALDQSHPPLEVIVVDDGSGDGSADVARSFAGVRVIEQENRGCAQARNRGIEVARGELLAFLDADDVWAPGKLELQGALMTSQPELGYTLTHQRITVEPGLPKPAWLRPELLERPSVGYLPSTLVARRWVFDRVGGFDPSYRLSSDVEWFTRAKDAGIAMQILPDVLVTRLAHGGNLSAEVPASTRALLRVFKTSIDRQRGRGTDT